MVLAILNATSAGPMRARTAGNPWEPPNLDVQNMFLNPNNLQSMINLNNHRESKQTAIESLAVDEQKYPHLAAHREKARKGCINLAKYTSVCDRAWLTPVPDYVKFMSVSPKANRSGFTKQSPRTSVQQCYPKNPTPFNSRPEGPSPPRRAGQDRQGKTAATSDSSKSIRQTEQLWRGWRGWRNHKDYRDCRHIDRKTLPKNSCH